jgi:hypothetical protein
MEEISAATNPTLSINLQNRTTSSTVYAYITGQAINNNNAVFLLQADGVTPYFPVSPSSNGQPLLVDCGIKLGAPGSSTAVQIPQIAGGRIWFCVNNTLTFLLNPGPGLVEPSVSNTADPNYNKLWDFCEFTFNSSQVFVNISNVDFVCLPISLSLLNTSGVTQTVPGFQSTGLQNVCSGLVAQNAKDGQGWDQLIIKSNNAILRALSPNTGIVMNPALFQNYYASYVASVWAKYRTTPLNIDTQAQWGTVAGTVSPTTNLLTFPNVGTFAQPSAHDIFSCSTGPFGGFPSNVAEMGAITARLAAAFNRSTLLLGIGAFPDGEQVSQYYANAVTNHYSRIVHAVEVGF